MNRRIPQFSLEQVQDLKPSRRYSEALKLQERGLTYREIAEVMGIQKDSVKVYIHLAHHPEKYPLFVKRTHQCRINKRIKAGLTYRSIPQRRSYKGVRRKVINVLSHSEVIKQRRLEKRVGIATPSCVRYHIRALEKEGLVERLRRSRPVILMWKK